MSAAQLIAIAPLIALASTMVLVMTAVSVRRHHGAAFGLTVFGLAVTLFTLPGAVGTAPINVTPLFLIDSYALFFIGLITAAALLTTLLSYACIARFDIRHEEYYLLLLITTLGAAALAASVHLGSFFLSLETTSVGLFALIAYRRDSATPIEAAIKYLVLVGVSTALLTFGMALFYATTGALSFSQIGDLTHVTGGSTVLLAAYLLMIAGVGFKLSLVPFHLWTPDVYQGAPAPITGFLATVSKGAVFAVLLRFMAQTNAYENASLLTILTIVAIASMLVGNWLALLQDNVKRVLAYSSIAHLGYLLVPLIAGGALGVEAAMFYFAAYFATTLGAFAIITVLSQDQPQEAQTLDAFRGLFWHRPGLAAVFSLMLLSLAGIPLTAGFPAKFYALAAGVGSGLWILTLALVAGSAIGLFYYLRIVITMAAQTDAVQNPQSRAVAATLCLVLLTAIVLVLGVYPGLLIPMLQAGVNF